MDPVTNERRIPEREALLEWALAEMKEWEENHTPPPALCAKIRERGTLTTAEEDAALDFFLRTERRRHEVAWIRRHVGDAEWYAADFALSALGDVVLHDHWSRNAPAPGWTEPLPRTVTAFAQRGGFPEASFDLAMNYRPLYVAADLSGPWHIAEGSHRSDAIWKAYREGRASQRTFRVILGTHRRMLDWYIIAK